MNEIINELNTSTIVFLIFFLSVGVAIISDFCSIVDNTLTTTEQINYKLIATVQRYYNFIWDGDQASPRSEMVLLYEDKEMNKRCYKGNCLMIKEYLDTWKDYELTTKQLKNILVKLNCKFEREVC